MANAKRIWGIILLVLGLLISIGSGYAWYSIGGGYGGLNVFPFGFGVVLCFIGLVLIVLSREKKPTKK